MALAVALTAVQACADRHVKEAVNVADSFVKAYFAAEYDRAAEMCGVHVGEVYEHGRDSLMVDFDILVPDELEPMRNSVLVVRDPEAGTWSVEEIR